jgi:hypothetical protein
MGVTFSRLIIKVIVELKLIKLINNFREKRGAFSTLTSLYI